MKYLTQENARLKKECAQAQIIPQPVTSYAEMTSKPAVLGNRMSQLVAKTKKASTLFISGKENESIKDVQKTFTKTINPAKDRIKLKSIRTTHKTLIVETADEADLKKLKEHKTLNAKLVVEVAKKKKPLVILYDVPSDMSDKEVTEAIYDQNLSEEVDEKTFKENFSIRFKTGPKGKHSAPGCRDV